MQKEASASQQRRASAPFTARVHVHDICQVLLASMCNPSPGAIVFPKIPYQSVYQGEPSRGPSRQSCHLLRAASVQRGQALQISLASHEVWT